MSMPLEPIRQRALDSYRIVDTLAESVYDDIVQVASQVCDTPIALISLSDHDRQWFKARVGLDAEQIPRCGALCDQAIDTPDRLLEITDALQDPRYVDHLLVTAAPHLRFYAGMPLVTPGGHALGTLCVIDRQARQLTVEQRAGLQALARVTVALFETRRRELGNIRQRADRDFVDRSGRGPTPAPAPRVCGTAVAIVELDHIAAITSHRGKEAGEAALQRLVHVLETGADPADLVCRHGDNEFLVVLADSDGAEHKMQEVCARVARDVGSFPLSVSIGVAIDPDGSAALEDVFERADAALQQAKSGGRNRVVAVGAD